MLKVESHRTIRSPSWKYQSLGKIGLVAVFCLLPTGCQFPGQPDPANRPQLPAQIMSFHQLFSTHCAGCHGVEGEFGPAPPLRDPLFRASIPMKELEKVLHRGRPNYLMPAFGPDHGGPLTNAQIQVLVHEIKGVPYRVEEISEKGNSQFKVIADKAGETPVWGVPSHLPKDAPRYLLSGTGKKDKKDIERGKKIFSRACSGCHGGDGQGSQSGHEVKLRINDPDFLQLMSDQVLYRLIFTGRPDLGMPSYRECDGREEDFRPLSAKEIEDLVALLVSWREKKAK